MVRLLLLGGMAGGAAPSEFPLLRLPSLGTPLGGSAGGGSRQAEVDLCGSSGELVASCEAVTDLVFSVPVWPGPIEASSDELAKAELSAEFEGEDWF